MFNEICSKHYNAENSFSLKIAIFCEGAMALIKKVRKVYYVFILITLTFIASLHYGLTGIREETDNTTSKRDRDNLQSAKRASLATQSVLVKTDNKTANATSRWIIISIAVTSKMPAGYVFCVPFVVAAWKRIGWHSLILVAGDIEHWRNSPLLKLIRQTTFEMDDTTRFVTIPVKHNPVSYAQVSRSFSTLLAPWIQPDDTVMTSDVDIFPLKGTFYNIVTGSEIFVLNADCCSTFLWRNQKINMQPMTSIGMSLRNWFHVMDLKPLQKNETFVEYVNLWLAKHYGKTIPDQDVEKGENEIWYLDQRVVSIQLHRTNVKVNKIRRNTHSDRVDRVKADSWRDFRSHVDAHMFLESFRDTKWAKTVLLINDVFTEDVVNKLKQFKDLFMDMNTDR